MNLFLIASCYYKGSTGHLVVQILKSEGTSKALVTRSEALVSNSFLLLLVRHLLLVESRDYISPGISGHQF